MFPQRTVGEVFHGSGRMTDNLDPGRVNCGRGFQPRSWGPAIGVENPSHREAWQSGLQNPSHREAWQSGLKTPPTGKPGNRG